MRESATPVTQGSDVGGFRACHGWGHPGKTRDSEEHRLGAEIRMVHVLDFPLVLWLAGIYNTKFAPDGKYDARYLKLGHQTFTR